MRKDESKISEHAKHTRKRTGLRRQVNKAVRRNVKVDLFERLSRGIENSLRPCQCGSGVWWQECPAADPCCG